MVVVEVVAHPVPVPVVVVAEVLPLEANDPRVASRPWSLEDSVVLVVAVVELQPHDDHHLAYPPKVRSVPVTLFHLRRHHHPRSLYSDVTGKVSAVPSLLARSRDWSPPHSV